MKGKGCGEACRPISSNFTMDQYVKAAFEILLDPKIAEEEDNLFCLSEEDDSQFLGISWWSFSHQMTYPPMKWFDNEFLPANPPPLALDTVRENLPKLKGGVTCSKSSQTSGDMVSTE